MVDDNDEYQFAADLGEINSDVVEEAQEPEVSSNLSEESQPPSSERNIKRNALIVVGIVILIMVLYKIMGALFSEKQEPVKATRPVVATAPVQPQLLSVEPPVPREAQPSVDSKITDKLSALESGQESLSTGVTSANNQLEGISTNVNTLIAKMAELNGIITSLSAKIDAQAEEIQRLMARTEARAVHHVTPRHAPARYTKYNIQAVIPGRAWLIAANGATLTVREGTIIPGYGMVKLIDPSQGRVMTSSGQVIRFSQEDS